MEKLKNHPHRTHWLGEEAEISYEPVSDREFGIRLDQFVEVLYGVDSQLSQSSSFTDDTPSSTQSVILANPNEIVSGQGSTLVKEECDGSPRDAA